VVLPDQSVPIDPLDPYPCVAGLDAVRQWPEVVDGAGPYDGPRPKDLYDAVILAEDGRVRVPVSLL